MPATLRNYQVNNLMLSILLLSLSLDYCNGVVLWAVLYWETFTEKVPKCVMKSRQRCQCLQMTSILIHRFNFRVAAAVLVTGKKKFPCGIYSMFYVSAAWSHRNLPSCFHWEWQAKIGCTCNLGGLNEWMTLISFNLLCRLQEMLWYISIFF